MNQSYNINIVLERLLCHDEGDGSGNSEPFIWAAFFKIDNDTATINNYRIEGKQDIDKPVQVHFGIGSHNNLSSTFINISDDGMDAGNNIPIPPKVGSWNTTLTPTEIPDFFNNNTNISVPGVAGVLYMLMEEDSVAHHASLAGQHAFNAFFETQINIFFRSLDFPKIFEDAKKIRMNAGEINIILTSTDLLKVILGKVAAFTNEIRDEGLRVVKNAILGSLTPWEMAAAIYDADDFLGMDLQIISTLEITTLLHKPFSKGFSYQGDGQLAGGGLEIAGDGAYSITGYINGNPVSFSLPPFTDRNPEIKGATVYMNVNFDGESKFLKLGDHKLGARVRNFAYAPASPFNNEIDSIQVDSGYYAELYKTEDFTGEMLKVTYDNPVAWFDDNWRDQISSIRVGSLTNGLR